MNGTHRNGWIAHSHYDWKTNCIGFHGEQLVVHLGVYDVTMRIGSARVRVAGVNADKIHPDYRDTDYGQRAVQEAIEQDGMLKHY